MTATKIQIKKIPLIVDDGNTEVAITSIVAAGHRGHLADRLAVTQVPNCPSKKTLRVPIQRVAVFDGVTPRDSSLMHIDMATYATTIVNNRVYARVNIPDALLRANNALYNPEWKTYSPATMCAIGDIYLDPNKTEFQLEGEFYAAGDCEIYLHRANGWEMVHGKRMLADDVQELYNELENKVKVFWDEADAAHSKGEIVSYAKHLVASQSGQYPLFEHLLNEIKMLNDFDKLYVVKKYITEAMLIPAEELLAQSRESYLSPPIGRYPTSTLSYDSFALVSPDFPSPGSNHQDSFDGVIVCTDGAKIDPEKLRQQEVINRDRLDPTAFVPDALFGKAHSGADRAIITLHLPNNI
jgi:hypothetical protein